jgi:steroid 5-alpha reductase family enzyme
MDPLLLPLIALAAASAGFAGLFLLARRIGNFGIVDIAWAAGFAPVAALYGLFGGGGTARRALITAMAILWSARLGWHLGRRVIGHHPVEDARYVQLRRDWAGNLNARMFGFFQCQGLLLVLLSTPFFLAAHDRRPGVGPVEIAGAVLWLVSLAGEATADAQLAAFKRDPSNRGKVCDTGLWGLSRHPNYFFEWLVWVAFALVALPSPWGWTALGCPVLMFLLLTKLTGIAYTEAQLLRSKGEPYRAYQRRTSAFVPWPRRGRHPSPPP